MIRTRAALVFILSFSAMLLGLLSHVHAPAQALPTVPADIKTSGEVAAAQTAIQQFITQAVGQLASDSPDAQSRAREALTREALVNGQPTAHAAYLNLYTQVLNQQLLALAKNASPRVRMNAAIVTWSVANTAKNANLAPAAIAFINDASPAVVLWGVKSGRALVPAQLRAFGGGGPQLAPDIVAAAKKHPKGNIGGAIAGEAYRALTLDIAAAANVTPQMTQAVIPHVQDLMVFRVGEYRKGIPAEPGADLTGASFLVHSAVWPVQTPQQQATTVQLLSDLLSLATDQAVAANPTDAAYLTNTMIRLVASSLSVAASHAGEKGIVQAVTPVVLAPRGTGAAQMAPLVKAVHPAIKASAKFAATNPPPSTVSNEPPPPPASAPTTGPVAIPGANALPPDPAVSPATPAPAAP